MIRLFENLQYVTLALTIIGQIAIGGSYLVGQGCWLVANLISVSRCFVLKRPMADTIKESALTALTFGLIMFHLLWA